MRRNGLSNGRKVIRGLQPMPGMISPFTLLKITQGFRKIEVGEIMEIMGTDPDTWRDFLKVLGLWPCEVIGNAGEVQDIFSTVQAG